jgi:hypothetical protein
MSALAALDGVSLRQAGTDEEGVMRSAVLLEGAETGLTVAGRDLGPCFRCRHGVLLFVEYGDDWEQSLTITLASADWQVLDSATLGWSGKTGHLRDMAVPAPETLRFGFFEGAPWQLRVHPEPRFVVPFAAVGVGLQRPFQWRRWFSVGPG